MTVSVSGDKVTAVIKSQGRQRESEVPFDLTPASDDTFWGRALPGMDLVPFLFTRGYQNREAPVRSATVYFGGRYIDLAKK